MNREQVIAQSLVSWIGDHLHLEQDIARDGLPGMDVEWFLRGVLQLEGFVPSDFSIALAGFGVDSDWMAGKVAEVGAPRLGNTADDFNTAAAWRNDRLSNRRILAFARGRQPGVHTLKHLASPNSRDLARSVLNWACANAEIAATGPQRDLLRVLASSPELEPLCSLEAVADFVACWTECAEQNANDAPRAALPHLGLFADLELFNHVDSIENRLVRNIDLMNKTMDMESTLLKQRRDRYESFRDESVKAELLDILDRVDAMRLNPSPETRASLTLIEVMRLENSNQDSDDAGEEPDDGEHEAHVELDLKDVTDTGADALLDNRQEDLVVLADAIEDAWEEASEQGATVVQGDVAIEGNEHHFSFEMDQGLLDWLHTFCCKDVWGGLVESAEPSLDLALRGHSSALTEPEKISPENVGCDPEGRVLSVDGILQTFEHAISEENLPPINLLSRWQRFCELRAILVENLDYLVYLPVNWLAGRPQLAEQVEEYLELSSGIYGDLQRRYRDLSDLSEDYARTLLEALLTLDVLQVRIRLEDSRIAHKAVLLPTHPLHLWRYQRMSALLRGLGSQLTDADRDAVLKDIRRPEHFLSVIWLGSMPNGRGAGQVLPVANDIGGLATFENLRNAFSGIDGIEELVRTVDRFVTLGRHHCRPLRLAIVNPPEPTKTLVALAAVLNRRRETTLPCLSIDLYATRDHAHRLQAAVRFSKDRELLEDKIATGRLRLRIHTPHSDLASFVLSLRDRPCHIVALFDEATIRIRRRGLEHFLPMSPFCVRKHVRYERISNAVTLEPTSDEPPFSEYVQLINEAERGQRDTFPHACADADSLRSILDELLQGERPCAHWVYLADRALPSEGTMNSVRLVQRRDGQRQILLAAADYTKIASLIRPVFDRCNLSMSVAQLERLMEDGVSLIGAGLLDLLREQDGRPDPNRARGLAGMLLAARDYRDLYPQALLVSVDSDIARLWLRLGRRLNQRSDLLALRQEHETLVVEAIEVKSAEGPALHSEPETIEHACGQIAATLDACTSAIPRDHSQDPLSAPRCEMLKEVFVRACQSNRSNRDCRDSWAEWLRCLFGQQGQLPVVRFQGRLVRVLFGAAGQTVEDGITAEPFSIVSRSLMESRLQDLVEGISPVQQPPVGHTLHVRDLAGEQQGESAVEQQGLEAETGATSVLQQGSSMARSVSRLPAGVADSPTTELAELEWPPPVNALGMIGLTEPVAQLTAQVNYSRAAGHRFPDKLLVGPAGVGKSSLARAIARRMLNEEEILFSGADLRNPSMIIARLQERHKIPARPRGQVLVQNCLLFIDEVHAISNPVATSLLSIMDDQRTTTIAGVTYDFSNVVLILATTDPGRLSEAFNSRPDKTYLPAYTLHELAGIVWLHGKSTLQEQELPMEICLEIAARVRCQPRRAVRTLVNELIPYFHSVTHRPDEEIEHARIVSAMDHLAVSEWFDRQRIDINGIDQLARNYLEALRQSGATASERLQRRLGLSNRSDFLEVDEYLIRLRLIEVSAAGRTLTTDGRRYCQSPFSLRERISRNAVT